MVTPYRADGSVDEEGAVHAIGRYLLNHGSHGLVMAGPRRGGDHVDEERLRHRADRQ